MKLKMVDYGTSVQIFAELLQNILKTAVYMCVMPFLNNNTN